MRVDEFNYDLPKELIAQTPYDKRDEARLMVLDKENQTIEHKIFKDVLIIHILQMFLQVIMI